MWELRPRARVRRTPCVQQVRCRAGPQDLAHHELVWSTCSVQQSHKGGKAQGWCCDAIGNGAFYALCFVEGDDPLKGPGGPWMLGEDAPGKLHPSQQDLAAWFQGKLRGDVESHDVGGIKAMWSNSFGNGCGESDQDHFSRWRCFRAVECRREDKGKDHLDLALSAPGLASQSVANFNGSGDVLVEGGTDEAEPKTKLPSQVSS